MENTAVTPMAYSGSTPGPTSPTTAATGTPAARLATPETTLPRALWPSSRPSPVRIRSASRITSEKWTVSSTVSIPDCRRLRKKAAMPAPMPPAAPAPGSSDTSAPRSRRSTRAREASPASSRSTCSGAAPFWGPNTAAAPAGPQRGLSMSHMVTMGSSATTGSMPERSTDAAFPSVPPTGTNSLPAASRKCTPQAAAAPQPPSLVALPPRHITARRAPW